MSYQTNLITETVDSSSIDEYDSLDELDGQSFSGFDPLRTAKCYHLGKAFMQFAQAHRVFKDPDAEKSVTELDVMLEYRVRSYPYGSGLEFMLTHFEDRLPPGLRQLCDDDYQAFLSALGYVLYYQPSLETPEVSRLLHAIQHEAADSDENMTEELSKAYSAHAAQTSQLPAKKVKVDYWSVLMKHGKLHEEEPKRDIRTGDDENGVRRLVVTLKFQQRTGIGMGSTIEDATQRAAQKLCRTLGL